MDPAATDQQAGWRGRAWLVGAGGLQVSSLRHRKLAQEAGSTGALTTHTEDSGTRTRAHAPYTRGLRVAPRNSETI